MSDFKLLTTIFFLLAFFNGIVLCFVVILYMIKVNSFKKVLNKKENKFAVQKIQVKTVFGDRVSFVKFVKYVWKDDFYDSEEILKEKKKIRPFIKWLLFHFFLLVLLMSIVVICVLIHIVFNIQ